MWKALNDYKRKTGKSAEDLAHDFDASLSAVYKYLRGERLPEPDVMERIRIATGGLVTANSWYHPDLHTDHSPALGQREG